jgi:hypothetical protein
MRLEGEGFRLDVSVAETLAADFDVALEDLAEAAMAAADAVSDWGKAQLRADTAAALGSRVGNAWRSRVYPRRGASLQPSITWWTNAPHIIRAFSEGATIRSDDGFWLAIPTQNAPQAGRSFGSSGRLRRARKHAITEAERRFGRLRYVAVPGRRLALLVADGVRRRRGRRGGFARASESALRRRNFENGVVMFVLVPEVRLTRRINPQGVADAIGRDGLRRFARAFDDITRRRFGGET